MTDKDHRHGATVTGNQRLSLALEALHLVRIRARDFAQVLVGSEVVAEGDPRGIATAAHRRAYDSWLDAVRGERSADPFRVRFAAGGEHGLSLAASTFVPGKRISTSWLGVAH